MALTVAQQRISAWVREDGNQMPILLITSKPADITGWAAQLVACTAGTNAPCGVCAGCKQVIAGSYPDVLYAPTDTKTISVKQIQELLQHLHQKAFHGKRLVVIQDAQRLSLPAAAALLKTLEEPAEETRFLLTTPHRRQILATIISRCQLVRATSEKETGDGTWPTFSEQPEFLSPEAIASIAEFIEGRLKTGGASPEVYRAYMRLRDYYKIQSKRGNVKLAAAVLLSTIEQIRK